MQFQLTKGGRIPSQITPTFTEVGDKIIASAPWGASGTQRQERFMVFTIRDSKIVDMQGFESRREAERFARG